MPTHATATGRTTRPGEKKNSAVRPIPPRTAAELLALVRPFGPAVEGGELVFADAPFADLEPVLAVLHTGVRALLTGESWYGCGSSRADAAPRPLDPAAAIPVGITLLCVGSDWRWDRIHPAARVDNPRLFAQIRTPR